MSKTDAEQSVSFSFDDIETIGTRLYKLIDVLGFAEDSACKNEECSVLSEIRRLIMLLEGAGDEYERALKPLSDHVEELDDDDLPCDIVELYYDRVVPKLRDIGTYYYVAIFLLKKKEIEKARDTVVRALQRNRLVRRGRLARQRPKPLGITF